MSRTGNVGARAREWLRGMARRPSRRTVAIVLAVTGIFLMGVATGRLLLPIDHVVDKAVVLERSNTEQEDTTSDTVPDVTGLSLSEARAVWADAGMPVDDVQLTRRAYVGVADLVVGQTPVAGAPYVSGDAMVLELSEPGLMPQVTGKTLSDVRSLLTPLGASLNVTEKFAPKAQPGTVLSTRPAGGEALEVVVTVVVASAGDSIYLADLPDESGQCYSEETVTVASIDYGPSLLCDPYDDEVARATFALAGFNGFLDGTLTLESATAPASVTVSSDTGQLGTFDVPADGTPVPVHLELASVSRLVVEASHPEGGEVVLGEFRVTGAPKAIAALAEES